MAKKKAKKRKKKTKKKKTKKTLFDPVVEAQKLNASFEHVRTSAGCSPARWMLDDVYQTFDDPERNFLEQFQTTGFNARFFELYLYAYFCRSGFAVDRSHPNPDFIVSRGDLTVAVEATTVNPSTSGILAKLGKKISDLSPDELREYRKHELPIRFGSPLFSKLKKKYWELAHCHGMPFVIAIEAFHDAEGISLSDWALSRYVFGMDQTGSWTPGGRLAVKATEVKAHRLGEKEIASGFFDQPDAEHVSAILFTNSGTNAKFGRMGFQYGIGNDTIIMIREGYCFNPHPDAMDPSFFSYDLDQPPLVEPWGQGLIVLHNPNCRHPVPKAFFVDAVDGYLEDGLFKTDLPGWHPMASKTAMIHLGKVKKELMEKVPWRGASLAVGAITKEEFVDACGFTVTDSNPVVEENGWFSDDAHSFLGVVLRDKVDDDWGYVVLARDASFRFRAVDTEVSLATRDQARMDLQMKIAKLLSKPQRIYPQGDEFE